MRSDAQINASRINGSKSEGATSPEGQNRCKTAAFKHGLTSAEVLVAPEEVEAYENSQSKSPSTTTAPSAPWRKSSFKR